MPSHNEPVNSFPKPFQGIWEGENRVVVGIDIGTTQSGVAFAFLEKGSEQSIHRVTQWPGQEAHNQQSKIPSLVWYDTDKKAVSFGAEALTPEAEDDAEDNGWQLAKHFKLHLHPHEMKVKHDLKLDALPTGVSLRQVYSDFLGYLLRHTRAYFEDRIVDGKQIWENHRPTMQFVIAHPNGWGIREQTFLRTAAVKAELTTAESASNNIRFVTEAEASVHFCIYHTNIGSRLHPGVNFAVCDAGGSTVDTTVYCVTAARPILKLEEARASACVQAGAIFVNAAAEKYIHNTLTNGGLNQDDVQDYKKRGVQDFEKALKRSFCDAAEDRAIEVAGTRVNNPTIRTRRGRMTLPGAVVKSFFDICLDEIKLSVGQQLEGLNVSHLLLVGGFGESPYLRQEFKNQYEPQGCQVTLTNDSTSKAVADGAVIWSTASSVTGRRLPSSLGIETTARFNPVITEHQGREVISSADGHDKVGGRWSQIAAKGVVIDTEAVARESFSRPFSTPYPNLEEFEVTLVSYSKDGEPLWMSDKKGELLPGFKNSCTLTATLEDLGGALQPRIGVNGAMYWRLYFDVCIRFGGTEWQAYLEWEEKGTTRTGRVEIIPDDMIE